MMKLELVKHIPRALVLSNSCSVDSGAHELPFSCNACNCDVVVIVF